VSFSHVCSFRLVGLRVYAIGARRLTAQGLTDSGGDAYGRERSHRGRIEGDQSDIRLSTEARSDNVVPYGIGGAIRDRGPSFEPSSHGPIGDLMTAEEIKSGHHFFILPSSGDTDPRLWSANNSAAFGAALPSFLANSAIWSRVA
jgi:hypothetical protein